MSRLYRIVHAPLEIAGQIGLLCEGLRARGHTATGYNFFPNYLDYRKVINTDAYELARLLEHAMEYYDIFHFHNSYTFLEHYRDVEWISRAGKRMIMHHRGNDVRFRSRSAAWGGYVNPYVNAQCSFSDELIDRNLQFFAEHMEAAIVQDNELLPYVKDYYEQRGKPVYVLPRLIGLDGYEPVFGGSESSDPPLVVHAPTQREFKGTAYIRAAVEQVSRDVPLRFKLVEGVSHAEAMDIYREADIIIDQVLCGAYGNLSVEAMALGKPVVCYIRPDLYGKYPPGLPIVPANPDTLYTALSELARSRELRLQLGKQGRSYVEKHHEASAVVGQLLSIYDSIMKEE